MAIQKVGVIGCGLMGSGIAQISAQAGFQVVVHEINDDLLGRGIGRIQGFIGKELEKNKISKEEADSSLKRIKGTTNLEDLADCDLIIEAIIENLDEKRKLYSALDKIVKPEAIFTSNTSSITIIEMASATKRQAQFAGLHFFNPVPLMKLVEVVKTIVTNEETIASLLEFSQKLGKKPVLAKDSPGFIVNLLLIPYLLDAIRAFESGVASKEDIDEGMKLGCGHPMGPLTLLDFVGLDTTFYIANIMFDEFKDTRYAAPPLLKRMVAAGMLGRKSGKGFYDYSK
ncbi:MAG: 3-hydroxybutyryl-CoA dehydrogenase [Chloroflexi bacterium]|uniref:3-hydroxybutyryl-CoA dehydrogenase n=1 Tax=Candidatus Chlorohelix allophototropha TaxID=3003348 RepID=A0A8T7M5E0_9CHLR|nr:3-hydroxybutyryl-CoA dehydrogenase [Chloroflexota bacterium]WJW69236.1 3-hydroxybutyryl-CoA dehydrogenase [Chloroflexota bacterium L227-S17]